MGGLGDTLGTIAVNITGDYGELQSALDDAISAAEKGGEQVAEGFSAAAEQADHSAESVDGFNESLGHTPGGAHEAEGALSELSDGVLDLITELGLVVGAAELVTETFENFSRVESATVALTALTGSAQVAAEDIERLEQMAADENLAFPALLTAQQRMIAFGFASEDIPAALQAAADAAAVAQTTIDETANAMDRMAASGMAGARQLVSLNLTTKDLSTVMGVAEKDVKLAFAALDQTTRLEVLTAALNKFAGQSQVAADTLKGQWQGVKNTFEGFFVTLGAFLEPVAKEVLKWFATVGKAGEVFVLAFQINLEKLGFYFDKFTGQVDAANAKAQEINANAAKFRALVEGGGPGAAGGVTGGKTGGASDLADLQAKIKEQLAAANLEIVEPDKIKAVQSYTSDLAILTDQLDAVYKSQKQTAQAIADFKTAQEAAGNSMSAAAAKANYFYQQAFNAAAGMEALKNSTPPVIDDLGNLSTTGERTAKSWEEVNKASSELGKQLDSLLGKAKPPADALHESMAKLDEAFKLGNLAPAQALINKIAVDDLPSAVAQQDRYVDALERAGVSQEKLNAAIKTQTELHEQLAAVQGASMAKYQVQLALVDIATKNLGFDTQHIIGTVATGAINSFDNALGRVGPEFAKAALQGGGFGRAMHQLFIQLAQDLLGGLISALVKMGEKFVVEKLLEATTSQATAIAGVTNAAGVGFANAFASIAAIPIVGPAMAPGVAAATEAAIIAGGMPLASAARGALLGGDTLVNAHADEMILPPDLSNGLQDLIASGNSNRGAAAGVTIAIGNVHGVTRETVNSLATEIVRRAKLGGAFR